MSGPTFHALQCWKQVLTHVGVGMGAASFWRGAWYVLDDQLFPDDPRLSAISSLMLGTGGMAASQGIVARAMTVQGRFLKPVARFGALYTIAMSCVLVWRGTWVGWDCVYEHLLNNDNHTVLVGREQRKQLSDDDKEIHEQQTPLASALGVSEAANNTTTKTVLMATSTSYSAWLEHSPAYAVIKSTDPGHLTASGMVSHIFAIVTLGTCGVFASVLAPPAAVSVIKDLAIKVSRKPPTAPRSKAGAAAGTTTSFKRSATSEALEYIPHLAGHLRGTTSLAKSMSPVSPGRSIATSAREFRSTNARAKMRSTY